MFCHHGFVETSPIVIHHQELPFFEVCAGARYVSW